MLCCGRRLRKGKGSDLKTPQPPQFITVSQRGGELPLHPQQCCAAIILVHSGSHSLLPFGLQGWAVPRACSQTPSASATAACTQRQMGSAAASSCMRGAPPAGSRGIWQMGLLWQSKFCGAQRWQSGAALQQCDCHLQSSLHISGQHIILLHRARQLPRSVGCTHPACGVLQPPGCCFVTCPACSVACAGPGVCLLDCFGLSMASAKSLPKLLA